MKGLILVFLLISVFCYADNMTGEFAFEVGYLPIDMFKTRDVDYYLSDIALYADFMAKIWLFDLIFIGGGMRSHFVYYADKTEFWPYTVDYRFELGIKIGNLTIGFRHNCYHPAAPFEKIYAKMDAAFEELYVRFEGKVKIF